MSHNVFINTNQPQQGSSRQTLFILPDGVMQAGNGQSLRISLVSFSMKANTLSNINENNSRFFIVHRTGASVNSAPVQITPGNYHLYQGDDGLVAAIQVPLETALQSLPGLGAATVTVDLDLKTDLLNYVFTGITGDIKLVCFTIGSTAGASSLVQQILFNNSSPSHRFSSAYEILGGANQAEVNLGSGTLSDQFDNLTTMLTATTSPMTSMLPPRLTDLENIYLRTNLPNTNWATADFALGNSRTPEFRISNILAKIHIPNPYQDDAMVIDASGGSTKLHYEYKSRGLETIFYQDNGANLWQQTIPIPSVSQLELTLSDEYGRILPGVTPASEQNNLLGYQCVLKVEVV
jgi:hypothetical protein